MLLRFMGGALLAALLSFSVKAQIYDLPCPAGSSPSPQGMQTVVPSTQHVRANTCVDNFGVMTFQGLVGNSNGPGISSQQVFLSSLVPLNNVVKFTYSATYTNASNIITVQSGDVACNPLSFASFGDVGKLVLLTQFSSNANINIPYVQNLAVAYNTTITGCSGNNFIISAIPSISCTPTATVNICGFAYAASLSDTALDTLGTTAWSTSGVCKQAVTDVPVFFSVTTGHFWNNQINTLSSPCGGQFGGANVSGIDSTQEGPMWLGVGAATPLIPYNFDFTTCFSTAGCAQFQNFFIDKIGINGLGQPSGRNTPANNQVFLQLIGSGGGAACTGATMTNSGFANWGVNTQAQGTFGVWLGPSCGNPVFKNNVMEMFFATPCKVSGGGAIPTEFETNMCYGFTNAAIQVDPGNGYVYLRDNFFANGNGGAILQYISSSGGMIQATGNTYSSPFASTGMAGFVFNGTGPLTYYSDKETIQSPLGTSGVGVLFLQTGTKFVFRNLTVNFPSAGNKIFSEAAGNTIVNDGGLNFFTAPTASTLSGTNTANSYEGGTITCAASAATIVFKKTYVNSPVVVIQDQTTAGVVTQTSLSNTQKVVGCPGATDTLNFEVIPNLF